MPMNCNQEFWNEVSQYSSNSPQCYSLLKLVTYFYKSSNRTFLVQGIRRKKEKRYKLPAESLRGRALAVPKKDILYSTEDALFFDPLHYTQNSCHCLLRRCSGAQRWIYGMY
ncbi:hypothetical protein TNCT_85691 [Trichonephila clavata]|uniref:Uncharacterized protein n=1 Tax=Trichonephila clavata TaxID=2740835 RepID=A0A8X6HMC2_TRICU|nr:hypothetical protein TNCT_85691 [Trichonephila clavata]